MARKKQPIIRAKNAMQALGVYRPEFDPVIEIYGRLMVQYDALEKQFIDSGMEFEVVTIQGVKKAPIVTTLESLRKDILAYSSQLGLTPSGIKKLHDEAMKPPKPLSPLEKMMDEAAQF